MHHQKPVERQVEEIMALEQSKTNQGLERKKKRGWNLKGFENSCGMDVMENDQEPEWLTGSLRRHENKINIVLKKE